MNRIGGHLLCWTSILTIMRTSNTLNLPSKQSSSSAESIRSNVTTTTTRHRHSLCTTIYIERDLGEFSIPRFVKEAQCSGGACLSNTGARCEPVHIADEVYHIDRQTGQIDTHNHVKLRRAVACVCKVPMSMYYRLKNHNAAVET